jgi:hypothetical protein
MVTVNIKYNHVASHELGSLLDEKVVPNTWQPWHNLPVYPFGLKLQ